MARTHAAYRLRRQADQISDDHECAYGNKGGHADGEQDPEELDLLVEAAHCSTLAPACYPPVAEASAIVLF